MLTKLAHSIIKYRVPLVILLAIFTVFMGYHARNVQMNYSFIKAVPDDDPDMIYYKQFKETFGEDGHLIIVGFEGEKAFSDVGAFNRLVEVVKKIEKQPGVTGVISLNKLVKLEKNKAGKKFETAPIFPDSVDSDEELDSLVRFVRNLGIYRDQVLSNDSTSCLIAISINQEYNDSKKKDVVVDYIIDQGTKYEASTGVKVHYAGLPYLRSWKSRKVSEELKKFLILSLVVTALVLLFFFRSFFSVAVPMAIITVMVIWSMGTIELMGYQMSILTGLIPPIIVVIGIPNCVYFLNKYHQEYRKHGNKIKALSLIIRKIGVVSFITNLTTAIGFLVVTFTRIDILQEFGLVAGLNILGVFIASIILVPSVFAFLPDPKTRHLKHLDFKFFKHLLSGLDNLVTNHRIVVYTASILTVLLCSYGVYLIKPVSYMVDDLQEENIIRRDLTFFENKFTGVMPFDIVIDTKKQKGVMKMSNIRKIEELEKLLSEEKYLSSSISLVSFVKAFKQGFYGNHEAYFMLPNNQDKNIILKYLKNSGTEITDRNRFTDSTGQITRISLRIADIGSKKLDSILEYSIQPKIDSVFAESDLEVKTTGTTLIFTKGTKFLIDNLRWSLLIAFILIAIIMAILFRSFRMILISLTPNIIPLIITGAIMGYFDIALKPSTALIFSIAFGISVDDSIHYLAKYRQELFANNFNVQKAVSISIRETGSSMIYTSIILFFGFIIFTFSDFGGTIALGLLTSITLFFALVTNLTVLPSLLLSFDSGKRPKNRRSLWIDEYDVMEGEISEEIDTDLLAIKGHGKVFDDVYDQEIEDLKKNKNNL